MSPADAPPPGVPPRRVAVLADDLTGAADTAAPFALRGLSVSVSLTDTPPDDVHVLAVVTDTRWRSGEDATRRVRNAVRLARAWRPDVLFVKVDSTLRGRVREDVGAALDAWDGQARAVGTPAFPGQGRLVRAGSLLVHGETTVPRVADRLPDRVHVVDAETHEQLVDVAGRIVADHAVAVGSGGLGRALAEILAPTPAPGGRRHVPATSVLVVAGTTHPVTRSQVAALLAAGAEHVVLDPSRPDAAVAVRDALHDGRRVVVTGEVDPALEPDSLEAVEVAASLASTVADLVGEVPGVGLVLTGGATALAVTTALGASELRVLAEAAEGLPLGEVVVGDRRIPVVTKSGGFGQQDALRRAADALEDRS